eukprot:scaffold25522_cov80-Phaeocystis_antarctica.AAC.2
MKISLSLGQSGRQPSAAAPPRRGLSRQAVDRQLDHPSAKHASKVVHKLGEAAVPAIGGQQHVLRAVHDAHALNSFCQCAQCNGPCPIG